MTSRSDGRLAEPGFFCNPFRQDYRGDFVTTCAANQAIPTGAIKPWIPFAFTQKSPSCMACTPASRKQRMDGHVGIYNKCTWEEIRVDALASCPRGYILYRQDASPNVQCLGEAGRLKRAAASQANRVAPPAAAWRFPPAHPTHLQLDHSIVCFVPLDESDAN